MIDSITTTLKEVASQPIGLVFALLLGFASAATSACCALPALGILVGYSGTRTTKDRKAVLKTVATFVVGSILSMMMIGGVAGFIGQVAQSTLGHYWKIFAGVVAIVLGLAALKLLPFSLSFIKLNEKYSRLGESGSVLAGILLGGMVAVSSLPCNPGIFVVIGASVLQGKVIWSVVMLAMFAIGFSLPLGAVLLGVSISRISLSSRVGDRLFRYASGVILLVAGFYFICSI